MKGLEILGSGSDAAYWKYNKMDGSSGLENGKAADALLSDPYRLEWLLTPDTMTRIIKAVNEWLEEEV